MRPDFDRCEVLTFDCYGTLIDWESGILGVLEPLLARHGVTLSADRILELYGRFEADAEAGPYRPYRDVLTRVVTDFGRELDFEPGPEERASLARSVPAWLPFPDTVEALKRLGGRFRLAVISNVDDDLFAATAARLGVELDTVVTAQQVGAYKPAREVFDHALERLATPRSRIIHVAQSLFHDIEPARAMGLASVWVDRRSGRPGAGATPPAEAQPDVRVPDLASLVRLARGE